jgi:hypothetical protein
MTRSSFRSAAPRGIALFFGGLCLIHVIAFVRRPGFDASLWWIDLRFLPGWIHLLVMIAGAVVLIGYAMCPAAGRARRRMTAAVAVAFGFVALVDSLRFYSMYLGGSISTRWPLPVSGLSSWQW